MARSPGLQSGCQAGSIATDLRHLTQSWSSNVPS
jgi:hypothetical protein